MESGLMFSKFAGLPSLPGVPSIAVVADRDLWIEANFKETELTHVRVGQPVTIAVDTYPDMQCTGKVTSLRAPLISNPWITSDPSPQSLPSESTSAAPDQLSCGGVVNTA